jgi:antitoxin ParD1/3/4
MAQMNISLPDTLKAWAEARVSEGLYSSTSDYIRDLMRRDKDQSARLLYLQKSINEGLSSPETSDTVEAIIERYKARVA